MFSLDTLVKLITEQLTLDSAAKILALIGTVVGGIVGLNKWQEARRKTRRMRQIPDGDFPFEVIKPGSDDVIKRIVGGSEHNPLADYRIPYQERQPNRSVRQELESAFLEKNWVLILGKSGLGKTREAAHLANLFNQEGWTVLKLNDQAGAWLDIPKHFPSDISPDDKLLFFLDDLNRWMYPGNPHELHPKAGEELARPLRETMQERLDRLLHYFEQQGKSPYVRVIATARSERTPDKDGDLSPWDKLQWEKYPSFWRQFQCYKLAEPSTETIVKLLTAGVELGGLQGVPEKYGQIARRNDGTFRNITLNLDSAKGRGLAVNNQEFSPQLDQTWRQRYNKVVQRYPLAKHAYDAVELLLTLNLWLTPPMLLVTTQLLLPGRGLHRWWQSWQLRPVIAYLIETEQILTPKDGQIEVKKTPAVEVGRYVPAILKQFVQILKTNPNYPAAAECFYCGNALYGLGAYEEAIASFDKAIEFKPNFDRAWFSRSSTLYISGRQEEAIISYDKALEINPYDHLAWYCRSEVLKNLGRHKEAIASYDKALKIKPEYDFAWYSRGNLLLNLGHKEEAFISYSEGLKITPNDSTGWLVRGNILSRLGRKEEAIASYDKVLEIKPDIPKYKIDIDELVWYFRGEVLAGLGRYEEAITSYDKLLAIHTNNHYAIYKKAIWFSLQDKFEEAINTLKYTISLYSNYRELAKTDSDFDGIRDDERFQALVNSQDP